MEANGQSLMGNYMPGFLCKLLFGRVDTICEPQFKFFLAGYLISVFLFGLEQIPVFCKLQEDKD